MILDAFAHLKKVAPRLRRINRVIKDLVCLWRRFNSLDCMLMSIMFLITNFLSPRLILSCWRLCGESIGSKHWLLRRSQVLVCFFIFYLCLMSLIYSLFRIKRILKIALLISRKKYKNKEEASILMIFKMYVGSLLRSCSRLF